MSETQQVQNSTGSTRSTEKIEDTFREMKVNEENIEQSSLFPDRPGERDCQYFLRTGLCGYGNSCRYNHPPTHLPQGVIYHTEELPERIGQPDCEYYLKTGACKYGSTCKYHHPKDRNGAGPVLFNVSGYPIRQGEKSCPYYMQTGTCRFGVACKFNHPQPHNSQSAYGMSSFPSVCYPYAGGLTMMSLPPSATYGVMPSSATYGAMPLPQAPQSQAYMPFMLAPSQSWANYMATSNAIYNMKTQPGSSSSASVPVVVTSHHHNTSERAECRGFMNTGTCKYGDDCKYSHPKDKMLQSPPNFVNTNVLPARPGQLACGNFKANGFCKFGANCKFDHSMPLNSYNNIGLTIPHLPTAYASPVSTHLKISSPPSHSDSSTLSNGNKSTAENAQPDKSEVHDSSSRSDLTALCNGIENPSSETKKQEDNPALSDNSEVQVLSDNAS